MTQLVLQFQKEDLNSDWSDRSLQLQKKKKKSMKRWLCWNSAWNPHTLHSPSHPERDDLCLHGNLIHKYTQRYGKRERGIEQARGCCVILLKVCVFNWLIFMSSFVVRPHSSGLQRQVGQKLRGQSCWRPLEKPFRYFSSLIRFVLCVHCLQQVSVFNTTGWCLR